MWTHGRFSAAAEHENINSPAQRGHCLEPGPESVPNSKSPMPRRFCRGRGAVGTIISDDDTGGRRKSRQVQYMYMTDVVRPRRTRPVQERYGYLWLDLLQRHLQGYSIEYSRPIRDKGNGVLMLERSGRDIGEFAEFWVKTLDADPARSEAGEVFAQ
ncbi:hypothetical protein M8818_006387 [Zalaria obscura]|uniref:Uncharacterized protein n=1 Tax=Zalaria obscura TaxID=2024903 RepID=A0ACC3S5L7_9PEZI